MNFSRHRSAAGPAHTGSGATPPGLDRVSLFDPLLQTPERTAAEVADRAARYLALSAQLAEAETVAQVVELAVTEGAAALGTASGTLCLLTDDGHALTLAASVRMPPVVLDPFRYLSLDPDQPARTAAVAAVRLRRPLWFRSNDEVHRDYPELAAMRGPAHLEAAAVIPIVLRERPLGVIVFAFAEARDFSEPERSFMLALAHQCAQALERIRLYEAERDLRRHEQQARAEVEASQQRLAFLVDVSNALTETMDYDVLLQRMAALLVPYLADYASLYTLEDDGRIVNVATAHVAPEQQAVLQALHAQVQLRLDSPHSLIAEVMRTGQPLLDSEFDWQTQYADAPREVYAYIAALRPTAHIIMPLIAREHALGVIVLTAIAGSRRLTAADLSLTENVAQRMALTADNARLLQQAQRLNAQLEQRMQERTDELLQSEARFHVLVDSVQDYAIYLLDETGVIQSWNTGAERIKGYRAAEIIGRNFSTFYTPADAAKGVPARGLATARRSGHFEAEGWRVRKDGTRFWANVVITPVRDQAGNLLGFAKVTRDLTERKALEDDLRTSREQLLQEIAARQHVQQQLEQAREAERARIAREVHDELGGALTGLKMGLRRLRRLDNLPSGASALLDELALEIDGTVQVVRRIAHELRPAVLDDFGLLAALEWQFGEFTKRSGLAVEWHCALDDLSLPNEAAIACFRIFQEALTNIARHAQATHVSVDIHQADGRLVLRIADDGQGLPADGHVAPGHLGLMGMRERAALIAGELDISSAPGRGTTVLLSVPLAPAWGHTGPLTVD